MNPTVFCIAPIMSLNVVEPQRSLVVEAHTTFTTTLHLVKKIKKCILLSTSLTRSTMESWQEHNMLDARLLHQTLPTGAPLTPMRMKFSKGGAPVTHIHGRSKPFQVLCKTSPPSIRQLVKFLLELVTDELRPMLDQPGRQQQTLLS